MRRILLGSILLVWIAFMAGVVVRGVGAAEYGLLHEIQAMLVDSTAFSLSFGIARGIMTGIVVMTLTAALWALMFALATEEEERRERVLSLGAAFSWVLVVTAIAMVAAIFAGAPHVMDMLFAIQMATLASVLAAGGVEFALDGELAAPAGAGDDREVGPRFARHIASVNAGLAVMGPPANDREPR